LACYLYRDAFENLIWQPPSQNKPNFILQQIMSDFVHSQNSDSLFDIVSLIEELERQLAVGEELCFEEVHDIQGQINDLTDEVAMKLPQEAKKIIEDCRGFVTGNISIRNTFKKILGWMAKYCEEEIPHLPEYR
jgi:hypothetical protein